MKNKLLIILFLLAAFGCSSKDKRYDDIDFIAYSWRIPYGANEWLIYCTTYALIDNYGHCRLILKRYYPKSEIKYCKTMIDKKTIDNILSSSKSIRTDSDFSPKIGESMYDGPSLKIRINKDKVGKTVHFYNDINYNEIKDYEKLYNLIDSLYRSGSYEKINDTLVLAKRRRDFIKYSRESDSILRPPPPPPSEVFVYDKSN